MSRSIRQSKILELINTLDIETQEELADELRKAQFHATQATVSRDIKELGLIKVLGNNKRYKYAVEKNTATVLSAKIVNMFRDAVISISGAGNIIVTRTLMGSAGSACMLIDRLNSPAILGSMAGEDTVFTVVKSEADANKLIQQLNDIISE